MNKEFKPNIYLRIQVLAADWDGTGARKKMLPVERLYAYNLKVTKPDPFV